MAAEQLEPVAQPVPDLVRAQHPGAHRGQLDGQRQAVQPPAHVDDGGPVRLGQLEAARRGGGALDEQPDRVVPAGPGERLGVRRRLLERRHRQDVLARHGQRRPAGRDEAYAGRGAEQVVDQPCGRVEQVLAIVDHQQQVLVPQVRPQQPHRLGRGLVPQVERGQRRVADQRRIPDVGELHEPGAAGEAALEVGGEPDRQPSLAHPARAHQADQTRGDVYANYLARRGDRRRLN